MAKKLPLLIAFVLVFLCRPGVSFGQQWKELSSEHFIVHFMQDESFANDVSHKAEEYYSRIASDFGYTRFNFWTWDNRVKIYIYPDRDSYHAAAPQPAWSEGMADYTNKSILSYNHSGNFVDSILPHETAHLIFRDFVGFEGDIPVWIDEGVAQWEEPLKRERVKAVSRQLLQQGTLFSVKDMIDLDVRQIEGNSSVQLRSVADSAGKRKILVAAGDAAVRTYYIESVSLVGFLIDYYGAERFTEFCRLLRDGKSLDYTLRIVYSSSLGGIDDLEKAWLDYLAEG